MNYKPSIDLQPETEAPIKAIAEQAIAAFQNHQGHRYNEAAKELVRSLGYAEGSIEGWNAAIRYLDRHDPYWRGYNPRTANLNGSLWRAA